MVNKRFGSLLSEGLSSVAHRQHKTIAAVKREITGLLVDAGFRLAHSTVSGWCQGFVPREPEQVVWLVRYCLNKGRVDRLWVESLLIQARYPERDALLKELFPAFFNATKQAVSGCADRSGATTHIDDSTLPLRPRAREQLVGREQLLSNLQQTLLHDEPVAVALYGLPGVGKTALAVQLSHNRAIREAYPDGILWAGVGPQPNLLAHLSRWGSLLGLTPAELSTCTTLEMMARLLRLAIGTRRLLLVIDDVWTIDESLAFQVGGPHCSYLLTTRFARIALHFAGTSALQVSELNEEEGLQLLTNLAPIAVAASPEQSRELVQAVGGLPLALTLLGNYLRGEAYSGQPRRLWEAFAHVRQRTTRLQFTLPLSPIVCQTNQQTRNSFSLSTSISTSYYALSPRARSLLLALAVFPAKPHSFSEEAALRVASASPKTLDALVDAGLLESCSPGRYTLHQTIADYARERGINSRAEERLIAYFTDFVQAHTVDYPALEQEITGIQTALRLARERGYIAAFVPGALALAPFLLSRGLYDTALSLLTTAREGAQKLEDILSQVKILLLLGTALKECGDYTRAETYARDGLALARHIGHDGHIAAFLHLLGLLSLKKGEYGQAETYAQEGLELAREGAEIKTLSYLLHLCGVIAKKRGEYTQSLIFLQEGLALARQIGDEERYAMFLLNLGTVVLNLGDSGQAQAYYQEGLSVAQTIGNRQLSCSFLSCLGVLANRQGEPVRSGAYHCEGLAIARAIGHREHASGFLQCLGVLAAQKGDFAQAQQHFQEALDLARTMGHRERVCAILMNLGMLALDLGDESSAEAHLLEGLAVARDMGHRPHICLFLSNLAECAISREITARQRNISNNRCCLLANFTIEDRR
jgi:tetratricopeptide (TPR) repeat protein